jgi:hypothetical protein
VDSNLFLFSIKVRQRREKGRSNDGLLKIVTFAWQALAFDSKKLK